MQKELLVVDDEPQVCAALAAFFKSKGFRVVTASTAQAALEQLPHLQADAVLLDLKLPDGSGLDVLSQLKARCPNLRVVVISGLGDQGTIDEAMQRGASSYLSKPFDFSRCFYAAMGIETVDVRSIHPEPEALARVPVALAARYKVLPLHTRNGTLSLATADPLDIQHLDELKALIGCEIEPFAVMGGEVVEAIPRWYGVGAGVEQHPSASTRRADTARSADPQAPAVEESAGIARLINELVQRAHANRATDLHIGFDAQGPWIRERIDGIIYDVPVAPHFKQLYDSVVSRIKVMASLDIAEHRLPQDGRIWFALGQTRLDLRVSVLPTLHGENLAVRLLEPSRIFQLDQLGMAEEQLRQVVSLLAKPSGLLLVTGPTGSGKTTSLYAFLAKLNTGRVNLVTIEDPVEHELAGLTQIQVQPKIGLTFSTGLRSMLRHDPNIIMVGEIRDQETASLAVRAAMTGHLVLSTLHTTDAASGITRLMDLGIEPFLLCSTVTGILSERLLRQVCVRCREAVTIDAAALVQMGVTAPAATGPVRLWRARGCAGCRSTGYEGRTGVFELLTVDHHIRSLIIKRAPSAQVRQSAISKGMQSLWQSGWHKAQAGLTSLDELVRALPPELH